MQPYFVMSKKEIFRRYVLFVFSVFVNAVGISVITKALLGTSAISSVPFVLSLFTPLSMGLYTIIWNILFVLLEMTMMKRREIRERHFELISQIPIGMCLGIFIDIAMHGLWWLVPAGYWFQIVTLLIGCVVLGLGISLEVKASVSMVAGEYLVQVISRFVHKDFGYVKVFFDITMVIMAAALSFLFLHHLNGVREGTLISALLVGPISHWFYPHWRMFDHWLLCKPQQEIPEDSANNCPQVITITREYGSGGRLLGKALAETLGIKFYDKELISMVAQDSRKSEQYVKDNEQRLSSGTLFDLILQDYEAPLERSLSSYDALFVSQSRVIRTIARREPCVIVGRCADYILNDFPQSSLIKIFCYTNLSDAHERCMTAYNDKPDGLDEKIKEANRSRINHYQHYTGRKWGDPHYYDLMINTGTTSIKTACTLIAQLYEERSLTSAN